MSSTYFINLWVTLKCNFRCRYCYEKGMHENSNLSTDTVDQIIKFIKENKKDDQKLIVNFHGGEPLLNFKVIKYFIEKCDNEFQNVSYGMTTNGYLLTDEIIEFVARKFDYNLSISIDGMEETHNFNRISLDGKHTHKLILENAKKLLKYNENVRVRMTYDRYNIKSLYENYKFFVEQGFKLIVPVQDSYSSEWADDDFVQVKNQFGKIKLYLEENNLDNLKPRMIEDELYCLNKCNPGRYYHSIDTKGNIYPCTNVVGKRELIIGNVFDGIDEDKVKNIKNIVCKKVSECEMCALYDYCKATRCVFINYSLNGDYYKPDLVECNMMNIKMELLEEKTKNNKCGIIREMHVEE